MTLDSIRNSCDVFNPNRILSNILWVIMHYASLSSRATRVEIGLEEVRLMHANFHGIALLP